jgi:tRNA nucleotidyltransferase/poly(A) polymerase
MVSNKEYKEYKMALINISKQENKLFDYLLKINKKYNLELTFRVAGGWVRDKIINNNNNNNNNSANANDIDIVLDKMTGLTFSKYLKKNIFIIPQNHTQSKHLEVVVVKLFGFMIDIVGLRTEIYTDSRIPQIREGTPKEDAYRRDFTINTLFYNINLGIIEDYTCKGIEDIKNKIITTPLDPMQTFLDDPLRILRAIRFSVQLNFSIDNNLKYAIEKLCNKIISNVSKERILIELRKMIKYNALTAFEILNDIGIFELIFNRRALLSNEMSFISRDIQPYFAYLYYDKNENDIKKILTQLKLPNKEQNEIILIIKFVNNCFTIAKGSDSDSDRNKLIVGNSILLAGNKCLVEWAILILKDILETIDIVDKEYIYKIICNYVEELNWIYDMKPILNGNDIMNLFDIEKNQIGHIKNLIIDYQIINKNCTKECIIKYISSLFNAKEQTTTNTTHCYYNIDS